MPLEDSLEDFCVSADAPPDLLGSPADELDSLGVAAFSVAELEATLEPAVVEVDFLVVEVLDACFEAARSALVSFGGVISGVLFGSVSDTLLPPHALTPTPASSASDIARV